MNMCCLIRFDVDMLALFKDIINKETNVNANNENGKMPLYLECGKQP